MIGFCIINKLNKFIKIQKDKTKLIRNSLVAFSLRMSVAFHRTSSVQTLYCTSGANYDVHYFIIALKSYSQLTSIFKFLNVILNLHRSEISDSVTKFHFVHKICVTS